MWYFEIYSKPLVDSQVCFIIHIRYFLIVCVVYRPSENLVSSLVNINRLPKPQVGTLVKTTTVVLTKTFLAGPPPVRW